MYVLNLYEWEEEEEEVLLTI